MSIDPKNKRVLLFIGRLEGGGAERVFVEYANGLLEAGVDVHLACLEGGAYEADLVSGVRLYKLGIRMRKAALPLLRLVRELRPDVLLSGLSGSNLIASAVGRLAGVPEIWVSVHSDLRTEEAMRSASFGGLESIATKISCNLATRVIAVSEGVGTYLVQKVGVKHRPISVVHNPVYHWKLEELAEAPLPERLVEALSTSRSYLVAAGRLEHQKGFDLLIESYRRSGLKKHGVHLVILGEGSKRASLVEQIEENGLSSSVHLPGFVRNPYSAFKRSRGFVLSSRWEGFGNVLVEAMACGTPVVAFDCPSGPAEVLGDTPGCIVVPAGDLDRLADAMLKTALSERVTESYKIRVNRARRFSREQAASNLLKKLATGTPFND